VVDPVDPSRNCAAAVTADMLDQAIQGAQEYNEAEPERFFFPPNPEPPSAEALRRAMKLQNAQWIAIEMTPQAQRLDIVFPQFQKACRSFVKAFEDVGFVVHRFQVVGDGPILMQWILADSRLPELIRHEGPGVGSRNAPKFLEKWQNSPEKQGAIMEVDGKLVVDRIVPHRDAPAWLAANLDKIYVGKHVAAALRNCRFLTALPRDAPYAAAASDCIRGVKPWQR